MRSTKLFFLFAGCPLCAAGSALRLVGFRFADIAILAIKQTVRIFRTTQPPHMAMMVGRFIGIHSSHSIYCISQKIVFLQAFIVNPCDICDCVDSSAVGIFRVVITVSLIEVNLCQNFDEILSCVHNLPQ